MSKLAKAVNYESNPYTSRLPASMLGNLDRDSIEFFGELISTIREQHNATQVGDTTIPWEELTELDDSRAFNLGSQGRFLHPAYGIITARYVEFVGVGVTSEEYDFGLVAGFKQGDTPHQWAVTTKLAESNVGEACGFVAGYSRPKVGQFGWLITSGINLHSIRVAATEVPVVGARLVWHSDGTVVASDQGTALGVVASTTDSRRVNANTWELAPASIRVDVWQQAATVSLQSMADRIAALELRLTALEAG